MAKKLTKKQTVFAIIGAILFAICGVIIGWYSYIALHGKEKMTATDVTVGKQFTKNGESSADIIEIVYHSNSAKNGLECLDIKFNYLTDDTHENIYWQGLQYVGKNEKSPQISWTDLDRLQQLYNMFGEGDTTGSTGSFSSYDSAIDYANEIGSICGGQIVTHTGAWFWRTDYKSYYFSPFVAEGQKYNYQSMLDDEALGTSTLGLDSRFTIQVGDESFYMTFKGGNYMSFPLDITPSEFLADSNRKAQLGNNNLYDYYTPDFIGKYLYDSVKALPNGTDEVYYFEMEDYFNYYRVVEGGGVGDVLNKEDSTKVINHIKSYFGIKVTVLADGVRTAEDSMFGAVKGSANFSLEGANQSGEYFMGKQVIDCDEKAFDIVEIIDGYSALKLKDSFIDTYAPQAKKIYIAITIDIDELQTGGYKFVGFTRDSGLDKFEILSIHTSQTINGQLVVKEVAYA